MSSVKWRPFCPGKDEFEYCVLNFTLGIASETAFVFNCQGWMEWEPPSTHVPLKYFYYVRQVNSTRLFPVFFGEQPVSAGVAFPVGRLDLSFLLETVIRIFDSVGDYTEFIGQATVRNWWNLLAPLNTKAVSPGIVIPIMKMGRWNGHQSILSLSWESLLYTGNTTPHPHPHECQQYFYTAEQTIETPVISDAIASLYQVTVS